MKKQQGRPSLRIASHLLEGTIVDLPKPLAVMEKREEEDELDDTPEDLSRDDKGELAYM